MKRKASYWLRTSVILMTVLGVFTLPFPARAETHARQGGTIQLMEPVTGSVGEMARQVNYTLHVNEGQVFSVQAWPETSDLEFSVRIADPMGQEIANEQSGEQGMVMVEAISPTEAGDYSIVVSSSGRSGDFGLMALPGYAQLDFFDPFDSTNEQSFNWTSYSDTDLWSGVQDGEYLIELQSPSTTWMIRPDETAFWEDNYVEVNARVEGQPEDFAFGVALRYIETGDGGYQTYVVLIGSSGRWAVWASLNNEWIEVSRSQKSPVIDLSAPEWRVGVLLEGYTFTVYFNGQRVGTATDSQELLPSGEVALVAAAYEGATQLPVRVFFDNLLITSPGSVAEASEDVDWGEVLEEARGENRGGVSVTCCIDPLDRGSAPTSGQIDPG